MLRAYEDKKLKQRIKRRNKKLPYYKQSVEATYGPELRGLGQHPLSYQKGLKGTKLGPANKGRKLSGEEVVDIEKRLKDEGKI